MISKNQFFAILTTFVFLLSFQSIAQTKPLSNKKLSAKQKDKEIIEKKIDLKDKSLTGEPIKESESIAQQDMNMIYKIVEIKPDFPGGLNAFFQFIDENYEAPKNFKEDQKLYILFIVEKDGSLSDIKIMRDPGFGIKEEVLRILAKSPKWKPALMHGIPVRSEYSLPVIIKTE